MTSTTRPAPTPNDAPVRITVVGLGPGDRDLLTAGTWAAIEATPTDQRFLRTTRHPAASAVAGAASFDHVYTSARSIDEVYPTIVDALLAAATAAPDRHVLYAVPGSPAVAERTVVLLREQATARPDEVQVEVLPALSFADLAWARLGVDPLTDGVRIVDGHRFDAEAASLPGPVLIAQCDSQLVLGDIKLELDLDGPPVTVVQRLGLADEAVFACERAELDRSFTPDHLTSLYLGPGVVGRSVGGEVARFDALVAKLRAECEWDAAQTHQSLTRHLLEETYEVLEAIGALDPDTGEGYEHLQEELGDLLFQICFHCTLAAERDEFTLAEVARGVHDKLVFRHPHVFGGERVDWEELKATEKGRSSVFEGMPATLPGLLYASKVLKKAATVGVALPPAVSVEPGALGDALLALVAAARTHDLDPEAELRAAADRLRQEATQLEAAQPARGTSGT